MLLFFPPRAAVRGHVFAHPLCVCVINACARSTHLYHYSEPCAAGVPRLPAAVPASLTSCTVL